MTDRELLEDAAKAACITLHRRSIGDSPVLALPDGVAGRVWNPLTDDGDALRLAVKLRIQFTIYRDGVESPELDKGEEFDGDPFAATRRAIVRAAALMTPNV